MMLNNIDTSDVNVLDVFEIVHEIKNSIAVCNGYLDIIDLNEDDDIRKYLSIIRKEVNRSMNIIEDFMLYGKINVVKKMMDINLLMNDLCNEMEFFVKSKKIKFSFDISDDEFYIMGDYDKLKQVFINLIKNSIEAIEENGRIEVISYSKNNNYYVIINDNGCGIDEDILKKIGESGVTTKVEGNGIGVSFSKQIIKQHSGEIKYESMMGKGTKVVVKFLSDMV